MAPLEYINADQALKLDMMTLAHFFTVIKKGTVEIATFDDLELVYKSHREKYFSKHGTVNSVTESDFIKSESNKVNRLIAGIVGRTDDTSNYEAILNRYDDFLKTKLGGSNQTNSIQNTKGSSIQTTAAFVYLFCEKVVTANNADNYIKQFNIKSGKSFKTKYDKLSDSNYFISLKKQDEKRTKNKAIKGLKSAINYLEDKKTKNAFLKPSDIKKGLKAAKEKLEEISKY